MSSLDGLMVEDVVITEKMDGENTTIHREGTHARSPDSRYHPSRDWLKAYAAGVSIRLSQDERVVGEYLYARHSVSYENLQSYFLGFAWIIGDEVQSWDSSMSCFEELGIKPVPLLYRGEFKPELFDEIIASLDMMKHEGFVVRTADAFKEPDMSAKMGKYVRADHVQSETHWMRSKLIPNRLAGE
ncbi:RNA ligase family protein [Hoeflea prorocentri]|uniref:RNA ligase family protein n=1 Tax=Hoeflea prorocentri TaxID=1922333 RepID=A0A9X3ZIQ2_9HYPH|nr:RNA ligase family protein [Hoeflea prorocentri]MCY6382679.1 RNA ligase family protein [Hoeflea prorocentri]MDA5400479.1 RNA ligase family protein [Hoeflea prorocentri]